jgi:predicted HAD superfamily phosphohydrolase YqeG
MNHKHFLIYFDFDDTLVYTSELDPYRNREGKTFLINNPNEIETVVCFPGLVSYFNELKKNDLVKLRILTNSPKELVKVFLVKHGFDLSDVLIFGSQKKPFAKDFENALKHTNYPKKKVLLIGDSAVDLLTAQRLGINCIQACWHKKIQLKQQSLFNKDQPIKNKHELKTNFFITGSSSTKRIRPKLTVKNLNHLEKAISSFVNNKFQNGIPVVDNSEIVLLSPERSYGETEIKIHNVSTYYPTGHENFYYSNSNSILRFKDIKKYSKIELKKMICNRYYYNGRLKIDRPMINFFGFFYKQLLKKIESLCLSKPILVIAAPNSLPEYCYKTDVNQLMADNLNATLNDRDFIYFHRIIHRVLPKEEAHLRGERQIDVHYRTMGIIKEYNFIKKFKSVIIFDDITTSGSQIQAIAFYIRAICGFKGDILGLTLGKTMN